MTDRLIPLKEAMARLSVSPKTFLNNVLLARKEGKPMPFEAVQIGKRWKVRESVIEATMNGERNENVEP